MSIFRSSSLVVFCKKTCPSNFCKIYRKTGVRVSFKESCSSQPRTLLLKWLWHRCFSVSFVKFWKTSFLQNTSEGLLLYFCKALSSKAASNAIAKSRQINWEDTKNKDMWFTLFFAKIKFYKDKVAGWKFCNHRN